MAPPTTKTIVHVVPYQPRRWAKAFHASFCRWAAFILHRRAGKTTAILNHHQRAATNDDWERRRLRHLSPTLAEAQLADLTRARRYGLIFPQRQQAKAVAWDPLKFIAAAVPGSKANEAELKIDYANGSRVQLFGADNPDAFRGMPFSGLAFDEYGQHPPNIFSEVLSKSLADHLGYAIFAGTIKGKNQLYRTWAAAQGAPEWFSLWQDIKVSLETEDDAATLMLRQAMHDDEALIAKGLMTQEEYDQEWFLSTEAAIKGAYYAAVIAEARRSGRIRSVPYDPALPVYDVWDLGKGPNMAVGCFQRVAREVHFVHYLEGTESDGIQHMIGRLQRLPYVWGRHLAPHDIKATELSTGKTRYELAKKLGWEFTVVPDIGVTDGINAGRLMFARLWIDETNCQAWLEAIGHYAREWFERLGMFGDHPVHNWASHPADMYRMAAVGEHLMSNERPRQRPGAAGAPARNSGDPLAWLGNV